MSWKVDPGGVVWNFPSFIVEKRRRGDAEALTYIFVVRDRGCQSAGEGPPPRIGTTTEFPSLAADRSAVGAGGGGWCLPHSGPSVVLDRQDSRMIHDQKVGPNSICQHFCTILLFRVDHHCFCSRSLPSSNPRAPPGPAVGPAAAWVVAPVVAAAVGCARHLFLPRDIPPVLFRHSNRRTVRDVRIKDAVFAYSVQNIQ